MKSIVFLGDSLEAVREFPEGARREAGFQLDKVQRGLEPDDWKPLKTVGQGVNEIRIREEGGAYRVIYVAKLQEAVYVLHAFEKKSQKTPAGVIAFAKSRLQELFGRG